MVREITLRQAGGSVTATLPKEMADWLHVGPGDKVYAIEVDRGVPDVGEVPLVRRVVGEAEARHHLLSAI
jgi:hypothetical protein